MNDPRLDECDDGLCPHGWPPEFCGNCHDEMDTEPTYSLEEQYAIAHVEERIKEDGAHSVTGCPRYSRAMCSYRRVIKQLEAKGWTPGASA